jgi:hypothetical protein
MKQAAQDGVSRVRCDLCRDEVISCFYEPMEDVDPFHVGF